MSVVARSPRLLNRSRISVQEALCRSPYLALRTVEVISTTDGVILKGRLPSYYLKQLAQTHASLAEQGRIVNEIEVISV